MTNPQQNPQQENLVAIVLAGGQSARMGRDKALIEMDGSPLIQRVCDIARSCASQVFVVTNWGDRYRPFLPESCQFISEPLGSQGPLVGFAHGLAQVQADWILLLACDLPRLQTDVLKAALSQLGQVPQEAIALLVKDENGWQSLCGFYRQRCLPSLTQFIERGGRSFQSWLAQEVVAEWQLDDRSILFNCNTPQDLAELSEKQSF